MAGPRLRTGWRQAVITTDKPQRPLAKKLVAAVFICILLLLIPVYLFFDRGSWSWRNASTLDSPSSEEDAKWSSTDQTPSYNATKRCRGPRGLPLEEGLTEDLPRRTFELPGHEYTNATYGSYEAIGLQQSWMTFEQRYGPYGFNELDKNYNFTRADWSKVDWADLQDECSEAQGHAKGNFIPIGGMPRMRLKSEQSLPAEVQNLTGRQAIVIRSWSGYRYTDEDMWNLRSIITEAALATQGEYTVYLLVHVKGADGADIYKDPARYQTILEKNVPEEFRKVAVLFHQSLLVDWYPLAGEYSPFYQIMQPMQLFATFYPEFDHYWQIEMDTRFTGHVGDMLRSFHEFGRKEPYKQSRERASWVYMPEQHGSYEKFTASINRTLKGGATVWGPSSPSPGEFLKPIGSNPPVRNAKDEDFEWGVGHDPDLLLLDRVVDPARFEKGFVFANWFRGINNRAPRLHSPGAQCRMSRALLAAVHEVKANSHVRLPGESTMPSFALWLGLQIVQLPMPKFLFRPRDARELGYVHNGGQPRRTKDGIANAVDVYYRGSVNFYARPNTFDYRSSLPSPMFQRWMEGGHFGPSDRELRTIGQMTPASLNGEVPDGLPEFMRKVDGSVYVPNMMIHPRKTYGRKSVWA